MAWRCRLWRRLLSDDAYFDLAKLIQSVARDHQGRAAQKGIELTVQTPAEGLWTCLDQGRIEQVVDNLVGNAIKFCKRDDQVMLRLSQRDDQARLNVLDTGPSLTMDDLSLAFQRYVRLSNKPTGGETSTGLGLPLCRAFVQAHGGTVGVHNNDDRGVTFWFQLPILLDDPSTATA